MSTPKTVIATIRAMRDDGRSLEFIAEVCGVSRDTVRKYSKDNPRALKKASFFIVVGTDLRLQVVEAARHRRVKVSEWLRDAIQMKLRREMP